MTNVSRYFYHYLSTTAVLAATLSCQFVHAKVEMAGDDKSASSLPGPADGGKLALDAAVSPGSVRNTADREKFYRHQNDGVSCSAFRWP